jgi:hypothetical protein
VQTWIYRPAQRCAGGFFYVDVKKGGILADAALVVDPVSVPRSA